MREMKDSGVEWIGEIPKDWTLSKIKNVASFINGDRGVNYPSGEDLVNEGISFLSSYNIGNHYLDLSENISKYITQERYEILGGAKIRHNDIIFCLRGSVGKCSINKTLNEGTIASSLVVIRATKAHADYLYYYLQSPMVSLQTDIFMNGTCAANLSAENVGNYYFIEPSIDKQQKIADYLDSKCSQIDSIIEKQQAIIEKLKEYKLSVITEAVTKGLNHDLEMKNSGNDLIKEVPNTWRIARIKNFLCLLTDYDANGSFADIANNVKVNQGEAYAWMVRATDLENKNYGISEKTNYCDKASYDYLSKSSLQVGDLIVAKRGGIGNVYVIPKVDCLMTLAPNTYLLRFDDSLLEKFMYYIFLSQYGQESLKLLNKSTTIGAVYKDDIKNLQIVVPDISEQEKIVEFLDKKVLEIEDHIEKVACIIEKLQEYKKNLIYEVVTGKKEV